jgi:protein-disulfide isomerase
MHFKCLWCLGLLATLLALAACSPAATPPPTATATRRPATATSAQPTATVAPGEVPVGLTEDGAPYRGDPNAPVTLLEFSEYL